jgi:hypothetical protein
MFNAFYDGAFSSQEKSEIMKSGVWPLIAGLHFNTGEKLYLCNYYKSQVTNDISFHVATDIATKYHAVMCDKQGFPILQLFDGYPNQTSKSSRYVIKSFNIPTESVSDSKNSQVIAESNSSSYLLNRLSDKSKPLRHSIDQRLHYAATVIVGDALANCIGSFTDAKLNRRNTSDFDLPTAAQEWALRVAYGKVALVEVPNPVRLVLDKVNNLYTEHEKNLQEFAALSKDMFDATKWIVTFINGYGYIAGKFSNFAELVSSCAGCAEKKWIDLKPIPVPYIEPLHYYRTLEDMPEMLQRELKAALIMAKNNRNTNYRCEYADKAGLVPLVSPYSNLAQNHVQSNIGCISWRAQRASCWIIVDA